MCKTPPYWIKKTRLAAWKCWGHFIHEYNPQSNKKQIFYECNAMVKNDDAYRQWRDDVAQLLQDRHMYKEAERWDYCDSSPRYVIDRNNVDIPPTAETVFVCSKSSDHDAVLFASSCDFRACPDCAPKHTARLIRRYMPMIGELMKKYPRYKLRALTFTRSISIDNPDFAKIASEGFALIQKAMLKVVGKKWKTDGAGMLANWELGPKGLKLHYHAIYFGPWVDHKRLSKRWKVLTGGDFHVWVTLIKQNEGEWQKQVFYALKYATKLYSDDKETKERIYLDPVVTVRLFTVLKNTRRIRSYGSLFRIEVQEEHPFSCSDCGAKMVHIRIEFFQIWRETGFQPDEWKRMVGKSLLNLRTADNYTPITDKTDNSHPKSTRLLPGFDKIHEKGSIHYDHE